MWKALRLQLCDQHCAQTDPLPTSIQGKCESCNAAGRKPRHLYILPGGVAEIFTSTPGRHTIVFKKRRGLVRLSIETGAQLVPCYVFGGTDFFHNLATDDGLFAKLSRMCRAGVTIFWGPYGLPIPYTPRVSFISCVVLMRFPLLICVATLCVYLKSALLFVARRCFSVQCGVSLLKPPSTLDHISPDR